MNNTPSENDPIRSFRNDKTKKKKSDYVEYRNIYIEYSEGLDKYEIIADVNGVKQRLSLVRDLKSAEYYVNKLKSL